MPIYEYQCRQCGNTFEAIAHIQEHEHGKRPACPRCKSERVVQRMSVVQVVTSRKG